MKAGIDDLLRRELEHANFECGSGQATKALDRLHQVRSRLDGCEDRALVFRCEWLAGWALFILGQMEQALTHSQAAKSLSLELDVAAQARASALFAALLSYMGLNDESYAAASTAVELAVGCEDEWTRVFCLQVLSLTTGLGGDAAAARTLSERAVLAARKLGDAQLLSWSLINLGCIAADMADKGKEHGDDAAFERGYEEATRLTGEAFDLASTHSDSWVQRLALSNNAEFYAYLGRFPEAHRQLERWKDIEGDNAERRLLQYLGACSEVFYREGRLEEARDHCRQALAMAEAQQANDQLHIHTRVLSEIYEAMGDFEVALSLHKRFYKLERQFEGEKIKQRARVAAIIYEADKLREVAEVARKRAEQSERDAMRDPLTGIANRRRLEAYLGAVLARENKDLVVIYTDIDHFKSINDRFSHAVGDEVIKAFAHLLAGCCRQDDLVARIGGEEFVLLLNHVHPKDAAAVCARILRKTREYGWASIAPGLSVTASIGLVRADEAEGQEALLALADARLYRAKANGRDQAVTDGGFAEAQTPVRTAKAG